MREETTSRVSIVTLATFTDPTTRVSHWERVARSYNIITAVRLRKPGSGKGDIVRTYDDTGIYIQPPKDAASILDDTVRMGEDDHEWMLFYAKSDNAGPCLIPEKRFEEVVSLTPAVSRNLNRLRSGWMGTGDRTAPYPMSGGGIAEKTPPVRSSDAAPSPKTAAPTATTGPTKPDIPAHPTPQTTERRARSPPTLTLGEEPTARYFNMPT